MALDGDSAAAFHDLLFAGTVSFLAAGEAEKTIPGRQVFYDIALAALCDFLSGEEPRDIRDAVRFYRDQVFLVNTGPSDKARKLLISSAVKFHYLAARCRDDKRDFLVLAREIAIALLTQDTRKVETLCAQYQDEPAN